MATASFGRKWLAGIIRNDDLSAEEKEQQIMDGHIAVTDGIKDDRDRWKAEADKAADLQQQLDGIKNGENWQEKFEKEHEAFESFKKQMEHDAESAKVEAAYRKLLTDEGISTKRLDAIMKVTDLSNVKLDKDGNLDKLDDLKKTINDEWGEFKTTVTEKGAVVEKPLKTGKATKTKEEIFAIEDKDERLKAIQENHELFGF